MSNDINVNQLAAIMKLSGLFHDNGKAVKGFQTQLNNAMHNKKSAVNAIRHELISAVLLLPLFETLNGERGFSRINTPEKVKTYFESDITPFYQAFIEQAQAYNHYLKTFSENNDEERVSKNKALKATFPIIFDLLSLKHWKKNSLLQSLIFLVLSHHKLPNAEIKLESQTTDIKRQRRRLRGVEIEYFRPLMDAYFKPEAHPNIKQFLTIEKNPPWTDKTWCQEVANAAQQACNAEKTMDTIDPINNSAWGSNLLYLARPALIHADYKESREKTPCEQQAPKKIVYANTLDLDDETTVWADSLVEHQLKVGDSADFMYKQYALSSNSIYRCAPVIEEKAKPTALANPVILNENSPFYWQNHISKTLQQEKTGNGFFGVLMSKTGAGKTKGAPQIMMALSKNARFNVALGMRTLTHQTYRSYLSDLIGFKKDQVSLMIGQGGLIEQEEDDKNGSDNNANNIDFDCNIHFDGSIEEHPLLNIIQKEKQQRMLMSPVSVMTIDHIIQAANQSKSIHTTLLLEIMTSDLILDEIDDYSSEDLIPIGKLIYLFGFYGRKVIVSSATSPNTMIKELEQAYLDGYALFQQRHEGEEPKIAYMSHEAPYLTTTNQVNADATYRQFITNLSEATLRKEQRHESKIINVSKEIYMDQILAASVDYGERYYEHAPHDDINVSIGFVRFNNTKSSMAFAEHLLTCESPENILIKVQNYHSRMSKSVRLLLESKLNRILKRDEEGAIFKHEEIQSLIKQAKNEDKKNVLIIVSTTSIQETGRDHDYDWCISEPYSDKSIIQCAGRVWRHRRKKQLNNGPNIGILSNPILAFTNPERCWSYPGIESYDRKQAMDTNYLVNESPCRSIKSALNALNVQFVEDDQSNHVIEAKNALAKPLVNGFITSVPAISPITHYIDARMASVEQAKMHYLLGKNTRIKDMGLFNFLSRTDTKLNSLCAQSRPFRKRPPGSKELTIGMKTPLEGMNDHKWFVKDMEGNNQNAEVFTECIEDKGNRIFINIDIEEAIQTVCNEFNNHTNWFSEDVSSMTVSAYPSTNNQTALTFYYSSFYGLKEIK